MEIIEARKKLIVAMDGDYSLQQLRNQAKTLKNAVGMFKVGMRLFTRLGPDAVAAIASEGLGVFLDLKYHDIPNTVAQACDEAVRLGGVNMFTVHAAGGSKMLTRAVEATRDAAARSNVAQPKILAVTVLTSLGNDDLEELGIGETVSERVARLAGLASDSGADGVIASPREISIAREQMGDGFLIVTPGIRMQETPIGKADDQRRTLSPGQAMEAGADYIVVGRPIIAAEDPVDAAERIVHAMAEV